MAEALLLSVTTFEGMKDLGVLKNMEYNEKSESNRLMNVTVMKLSSLPYLFHAQKWLTDVYEGIRNVITPNFFRSLSIGLVMFFSR